jgi:type II secretory pathway pseudopilin PulG
MIIVCRKNSGSVLVVTLMLGLILGLTLAGYLRWVHTQNLLVAQSQAWNQALAMAEAGIEEGLAQVNVQFGTNYHSSAQANWGGGSGVYGPRNMSLDQGSYSAVIISTNPGPTIISTGYARVPLMPRPVMRVVQVTTTPLPAFRHAMVAQKDITFKGNNIEIDSYDSSSVLYSTGGMYDYAKRRAGGDVASAEGTVNVNNANVNGKVITAPEGTFSIGANGFVGDLNFAGPGLQDGWYANDFNMQIRPMDPPNLSGAMEPSAVSGDTNIFVLGSGGYAVNGNLTIKSGETVLVNGHATLYVSGNLTMQGLSSAINIEPGASLKIYVAGPSAAFSRVNNTGNASTFQYFGLPTNTSVTWAGNDTYVGTVYAPQAELTCGGGGSTIYDFQGSCVVRTVTMNGHFKFHYDENLERGLVSGFVVTSWREL